MLTAEQQYIVDRIERITETGCWIWTRATMGWGYGQLTYKKKHSYAHHFAWEAYRGPRIKGMQVLHTCDIPACCNPDHLYLGTPKQNTHDRLKRGKKMEGEDHGMHKLTEQEAREIRQTIPRIDTEKEVAKKYGISPSLVGHIRRRKNWTCLDD